MVMRLSLDPSSQSTFSFTASCKEIDTVLSRLGSVVNMASSGSKSFLVVSYKSKVAILAFNTDTYVYIELGEAKSSGDGAFGFDPTYLQGLVKGRSNMTFTFTGSECEFQLVKGKYNGKLVVLPVTVDQATTVNSALSSKEKVDNTILNRDVLDALKEGISLTSIHDIYSGGSLLSYIDLTSKGLLTVSCFDQHHFGHYAIKAEQKGVTFKIALPGSHFQIIDKMVGGEEAKFFIKSESVRVEGQNFVLILPASQTEDRNHRIVADYIASLDAPDLLCETDLARLSTLTTNLFTIYSANTSFDLSYKEGTNSLGLTFSTNNGSASDSIQMVHKAGKSLKVKIEPRVFKDILGLIQGQGQAELSVKKQKWVRIDVSPKSGAFSSFVCALAG